MTCEWKTCRNLVLRDNLCVRHLKQKCVICMESVPSTNSARHKRLTCGHAFHTNCIITWFETSDECPTCREPQQNDVFIQYKLNIERRMRRKYMAAIRSLENEVMVLRNNT